MMEMVQTTEFWVALAQIMGINIVLSGDNAVVIALASRNLPPEQQKKAIFLGGAVAIVMRIVLTIVAVEMLALPYLKIAGAILLLWVAVQLLLPEEGHGDDGEGSSSMATAIRTILIADLVMSLDNVLAVAAAADGNMVLLIVGLGLSIPLIIFGSAFLLKMMERFPIIITIGAALLGYVAGGMLIGDPAVRDWVESQPSVLQYAVPIAGAILVVVVGKAMAKSKLAKMQASRT